MERPHRGSSSLCRASFQGIFHPFGIGDDPIYPSLDIIIDTAYFDDKSLSDMRKIIPSEKMKKVIRIQGTLFIRRDVEGTSLPSYSDNDLQKLVDGNSAVLRDALNVTRGTDLYGRYLVTIRTVDGRDASSVMLEEGHALPYEGGKRGE